MSERPPDGWDTQGTPPTSVEVADDILAGHLRRRGAPTAPRTLTTAILARVDETARERRWRVTLAAWRPRMAVAVSGLTLALVAGLLYVNATPPPIGTDRGSPSPSAVPTPMQGPGVAWWDPTQRALTPPELLRILATSPAPGTTLIVDDQLARLDTPCLKVGGLCLPAEKLVNAGIPVAAPTGGHLPIQGTGEIPGPLALRVTTGPNLEFLGAVVSNGLRMDFRASDLLKRSAMGGLFVVPAWLWATPPAPCPSMPGTPAPMPTSEIGLPAPRLTCVPTDWLTDTESTNPAHGGGIGFPVQHGAYAAFAVYPGGTVDQTNPSSNIYLVRDWAGYGEIVARLEPRLLPSDEAVGPTTEPTVGPSPSTAGGIVTSSDELVARVLDGTLTAGSIAVASIPASAVKILQPYTGAKPEYPWVIVSGSRSIRVEGLIASGIVGTQAFVVQPAGAVTALGQVAVSSTGSALPGADVPGPVDGLAAVHGWLRVGPPLPCPKSASGPGTSGVPGKIPTVWSQCPGVWILPSDVDPWAGPPNNVQATDGSGSLKIGDPSVPKGTFHVQDGAPGAAGAPREGDWLVRAIKTNACRLIAACVLHIEPFPAPGVTWYELVGPIEAPNGAVVAPLPAGIVLTQDQLVASVGGGTVPIGSIVIAKATIAPVILPSFPPDAGAVAGKIGPMRVYWASDPTLSAPDLHQIALRVRPDGDLDYLGPVAIGQANDGSTNALYLVQTLQGPVLLRRIDCDSPPTPAVCPLAEGDTKTVSLGPVYVPASTP